MATKRILLNAAALKIYNQALALASRLFLDKQPYVTPDLVFLAFLHEDTPVYRSLERALKLLQPTFNRIEVERKICTAYLRREEEMARGQSEQLFDYAKQAAAARGAEIVNEYDLFRSIFAVQDNLVMFAIIEMGIAPTRAVEAINALPTDAGTDQQAAEIQDPTRAAAMKTKAKTVESDLLLEQVGRDLTTLAREGRLEKIWFRDEEIVDASEILCRRSQRNLLLVGEPGVGKTAVVEGLAQKIISENCPERLKSKELVQLNLASLMAGATMQGEFEKRIQQLVKECAKSGNMILFFDEVDWLFGQGNGSMANAATLLKPALAQGELQIIGTITQKSFRTLSDRDSSLLEKFSVLVIRPPSKENIIALLTQLAPQLQEYHRVSIGDDAIRATVELAEKFLSESCFPGKAINLLDRCAARLSLAAGSRDRKIIPAIGRQDLAAVVSEITSIEVGKILTENIANLGKLETFLKDHLIGQDDAIRKIVDTVQVARSGLDLNERRPDGVFLLVGPTGVGKTEIAKQLAEFLSGNQTKLVRFDMSEFAEEHTVAKLIGAPPGYVGYQDYGQLTEKVRNDPNAVVLFDEIEKAHPRLFNVFLQIFDDGRLTDGHGTTVDFSHTIILLTSNLGAKELEPAALAKLNLAQRYAALQNALGAAVKDHFSPEFLNRLDDVLYLDFLSPQTIATITQKRIAEIIQRLKSRGTDLQIAPAVYVLVQERGFSAEYGARYLLRTIEDMLLKPLAKFLLGQPTVPAQVLVANASGAIVFSVSTPKPE